MGYKFNPFTANLDKSISYWSKNGTVLSPKSSERVDLSEIRAKDGNGLKLYEDGGNGVFIKDGGNVGINQNNPACKLHLADGAILAKGATGETPTSGGGTRLMWIPTKKAFRAGGISNGPFDVRDMWDDVNIGLFSTAFGYNTKASGYHSIASGYLNEANGNRSGVFTGSINKVNGEYSGILSGLQNEITGNAAAIFTGQYNSVNGDYSSVLGGERNYAHGDYNVVAGKYMQLSAAADRSFAFGYHTSAIALTQPNTFYIFPAGTAGKVSVGTATPATSAVVDIVSTTGALILPRMTTVQRNALTAVNGMLIYDITLNQTQTYENGAWRQV